jgi:SAM-dependent methyltransferase
VLEHVEDDRAALRELHRVLRPGGALAISVPHADYPWLWDPLNRAWRALGGRPLRGAQPAGIWSLHRRLYWPADLAQRVSEAGFAVDWVEEATHTACLRALPDLRHRQAGDGAASCRRAEAPATASAAPTIAAAASTRSMPRGRCWGPSTAERSPGGAAPSTFVNVLLAARRRE